MLVLSVSGEEREEVEGGTEFGEVLRSLLGGWCVVTLRARARLSAMICVCEIGLFEVLDGESRSDRGL